MNSSDFIVKNGRRLYKVFCKTCNADRGYQRSREANKNCKSCESTIKGSNRIHSLESKIKRSAWNQNITVEEFQDFSRNREDRERHHLSKINKTIFERDDFTCDCCSTRGGQLNAHHLESFNSNPDLRLVKTNIITLCKECHNSFHVEYGKGTNTREQYIQYKEKYGKK